MPKKQKDAAGGSLPNTGIRQSEALTRVPVRGSLPAAKATCPKCGRDSVVTARTGSPCFWCLHAIWRKKPPFRGDQP